MRSVRLRAVLMRLLVVAAATTGLACDEKLSDITGPTPSLEPTFSNIRENIFESTDTAGRTACVACHTSAGQPAAGGLDLTSDPYAALVNAPSLQKEGAVQVIPGDPDASYLIQKLEGAAGIVGLRMPRSGPPYLTDGQILVIERWIQLGARND
jgi:Planctomycete cytochrome C